MIISGLKNHALLQFTRLMVCLTLIVSCTANKTNENKSFAYLTQVNISDSNTVVDLSSESIISNKSNVYSLSNIHKLTMVLVQSDSNHKPLLIGPGDSLIVADSTVTGKGFYKNRVLSQMTRFITDATSLLRTRISNSKNYFETNDSLRHIFRSSFCERTVDISLNSLLVLGESIFKLKSNQLFLTIWKNDSIEKVYISNYKVFTNQLTTIEVCYLWLPDVFNVINNNLICFSRVDTLSTKQLVTAVLSNINDLKLDERRRDVLVYQALLFGLASDPDFKLKDVDLSPGFKNVELYYSLVKAAIMDNKVEKTLNEV